MGISDGSQDNDKLEQCALRLDVVNNFLVSQPPLTEQDLHRWQDYIFHSGQCMVEPFMMDVSTKLHRTMRHIYDHMQNLDCFSRASTEENERIQKSYKAVNHFTNLHIDCMAHNFCRARCTTVTIQVLILSFTHHLRSCVVHRHLISILTLILFFVIPILYLLLRWHILWVLQLPCQMSLDPYYNKLQERNGFGG